MEEKIIELDNVIFEYADGVLPDEGRERHLKKYFTGILHPYANKMNSLNVRLVLVLKQGIENRAYFDNISDEFDDELNTFLRNTYFTK